MHPFTEPTRHFISDEAKVWSSQKDLEDGGSLTNFHRGRQKEEANAKHTVYNENLKSCGPVRDIPNVNMTRDRTTDGQTSCTDSCMRQWRDKIIKIGTHWHCIMDNCETQCAIFKALCSMKSEIVRGMLRPSAKRHKI